jgi:acyl-CoA synthetase (AMP-forming)/AMP-acid ligase II
MIMRTASTLPRLPLFEAIASHDPKSTAVVHSASGRRFTYGELLGDIADAKDRLLQEAGGNSIDGHRIAFLVENSYDYVGALRGSPLYIVPCTDELYSNSPLNPGHAFDSSATLPRLPRA